MEKTPECDAIVFTDGGYRRTIDVGAWGYVVINTKKSTAIARARAVKGTTNNRMELQAVVEAIHLIPKGRRVLLISDSQYTIKSIRDWIPGWKKKGWKKSTPGELKNIDILKQLDLIRANYSMHYRWVKGHSGNYGNDYVDEILNQAIDQFINDQNQPQRQEQLADATYFLKAALYDPRKIARQTGNRSTN